MCTTIHAWRRACLCAYACACAWAWYFVRVLVVLRAQSKIVNIRKLIDVSLSVVSWCMCLMCVCLLSVFGCPSWNAFMFVCDGGGMYDAEGRESFGSIRHGSYNGMCPRPSLLRARDISLAYLHIFMHLHTLYLPIHLAHCHTWKNLCTHTHAKIHV